MPPSITLRAHAKLNLALAVDRAIASGPRTGMHPIASWMVPIALADEVTVVRTDRDAMLDIRWADGRSVAWAPEKDLAARAHRALEAEAGARLGARIIIRKAIPDGGGLGGGSSDAAAVLRALNELFDLGLSADRLRAIASTLGSDIPFFIPDPPDATLRGALVTGVGERIEPAPIREAIPVLLVFPPFGCPTAEVYRAFDERPPPSFRDDEVSTLARAGVPDPDRLFNDLAGPAITVQPGLGPILERLRDGLNRPVHVSGSGSTLFCLGATAEEAGPFLPEGCVAQGSSVLSS